VNDPSYIESQICIAHRFRNSSHRFPPLFPLDLCTWLLGCDYLLGLDQQYQERICRHSSSQLSIINYSIQRKIYLRIKELWRIWNLL